MTKRAGLWLAVMALAAASLAAADAAQNKRKGRKAEAGDAQADQAIADMGKSPSVDRKHFQAYLKERTEKLKAFHKARMDFIAQEDQFWNNFWNKLRDERQRFEVRIIRQTLDLFESLASLEAKDYAPTIADFEKMHSTVVKTFELQQKQKMTDFFASRDARWKDFAAEQEAERANFEAEGEAAWEDNKTALTGGGAAAQAPQAAPSEGSSDEAAPPRKARPPARNRQRPRPEVSGSDDKWH